MTSYALRIKKCSSNLSKKDGKIFFEKEFLIVYTDDILICSKTYQEHLTHLKECSYICLENEIKLS
ncbi:hypothetical protein RDI58_007261 [Solanum bulbocastanum]|uniref:Uncharacterized protein n=1 Tax=Solanum bulbocastanum TaxID=147425 RepID=A0AAN8U006_SOLBU